DTDPENDALTAAKTVDPGHGSVTLSADGGFTYTPNTGFTGVDMFKYRANDTGKVITTDETTSDFLAGDRDGCTVLTFDNTAADEAELALTPTAPAFVDQFSGALLSA